MAQRDVTESPTFAAGFELARRLRDPAFRAILNRLRCPSSEHIIMALDDEPVVDIIGRMMLHRTGGRAVIAIPHPDEPFGFRLLGVEVTHEEPSDAELIELGPGASIGMLYTHLQPVGTYVPSELSRPLLFERVPA